MNVIDTISTMRITPVVFLMNFSKLLLETKIIVFLFHGINIK